MSETIVETITETIVEPVEQVYRFQPTDEQGRPIGGTQVIKYKTHDELASKLQEQNVLLIRKLREQTKKIRLGIDEREEIGEDAQRSKTYVEFTPRQLTNEENYELARKLQDPTTASQAAQEIVEAQLGGSLSTLGETLKNIQEDNNNLRAKMESNAFVADNPAYYRCAENFEAITSWMVRYDLAPVRANFQKAYETLLAQDLLVTGAAPVRVAPAIVAPIVETVIEEVPARQELPNDGPTVQTVQRRVPTGLTRDMASDTGTPPKNDGSDITYVLNGNTLRGLDAVAAMPGEEYKRRLLTEKGFGKKVDALEATRKVRN
jgi:hypothetical protein